MKISKLLRAVAAITSLAVPAIAQTQSTTTTTTTNYVQSSAVVGAKIKDARGEDVGVIKDFVLDRNTGCLAYVVLSTGQGGAATSETKTVAAPWTVFSASSEPRTYVTRIERERLYSAPVWEASRVDEYTRTEYLNNVYSYYGVPAPRFGAEVNAGISNTTTSTTGAAGSTGLSTSTGATNTTASPAATAAGSTPMSSPKAPPTSSATAHPVSSPLGTPERSAAPRMTAPASSPKKSSSTRDATRESSPSTKTESGHKKESPDEASEKSTEPRSDKEEAAPDTQSHSGDAKKRRGSEGRSHPETAPSPR